MLKTFQSTHPVWGATRKPLNTLPRWSNFNPRTPCGVRREINLLHPDMIQISIHAPRVGCDLYGPLEVSKFLEISIHAPRVGCDDSEARKAYDRMEFQSTHPVWGATTAAARRDGYSAFQSTHPVWGATRKAHQAFDAL